MFIQKEKEKEGFKLFIWKSLRYNKKIDMVNIYIQRKQFTFKDKFVNISFFTGKKMIKTRKKRCFT